MPFRFDPFSQIIAVYDGNNANQLLRTYTWGKDLYGPGGIGGLLSMEIKSGTQQGKYLYSYDAKG
ncbi:MAG: hypothetical protein MJA84_06120, partial [Firmicutes bacterium]|nr:hypothetical protein [Bacillota bacterium]